MTKGHFPALDGLRGLAILAVMVYHFVVIAHPANRLDDAVLILSASGWIGVDLFFVLSGFLITGILLDGRDSPGYFRTFYFRRTLRIFPLYFGYLAVLYWLAPQVAQPATVSELRTAAPWYWSYLANWYLAHGKILTPTVTGQFWSLAVEEQFYMVWPIVVLLLSRVALKRVAIGAILGVLVLRPILLFAFHMWPYAIYVLTPTHLDGLAVGAFLAADMREPEAFATWQRAKRWLVPIAGVLLAIVAIHDHGLWDLRPLMQSIGYPAVAVLFGAALARVVTNPPVWMSSTPLRAFGKYSYGLYITHQLVPLALGAIGVTATRSISVNRYGGSEFPEAVTYAVLCGAMAFLLAYIIWHGYERPFLNLRTSLRLRGWLAIDRI